MEIMINLIDVVFLVCVLVSGLAIEEIIDGVVWTLKNKRRQEDEDDTE